MSGVSTIPEDSTLPKHRFIELIKLLHSTPSPDLNPPKFIFNFTEEAAEFNARILASAHYDLDKIIRAQHPSQISYGAEFRLSDQLEELLAHHPFWPRLKEILDNGATFPLDEILSSDRAMDLSFHKNRGNHKSASDNHQILLDIIKEDVERGFALPLPINSLQYLPNASLAPLGCIKQSTLDASGNRSTKHRMTHVQSFLGPSSLSVNLRVQQDKLPPIMYSFVLLRSIHYILSLRHQHPSTKYLFVNLTSMRLTVDAIFQAEQPSKA
jgi:hypothetical protein